MSVGFHENNFAYFRIFFIKSIPSLPMFLQFYHEQFDYFANNNGRQEDQSVMLGSPRACVGKEKKIVTITKPKNDTKKLNLNQKMGCKQLWQLTSGPSRL
jgi:hypothetical protein